ncbi:MAG: alpha/beta fold hydrolase, partial [Rhizobiaceae bacterium]
APPAIAAPDRFYTLDLPTEAPIAEQARLLAHYVAFLEARHEGDPVVLAGHSAGGVAARMYLVVSRDPTVAGLVTIASPHLGTGLADAASAASRSPLAFVAPMVGAGALNRSRALYDDLGRENPWNLVGWLNRQPHPPARYVAVIRSADGTPLSGDRVSEAWRQDLRNVPALGARAEAIVTPAGHGLQPQDGRVIADMVRSLAPNG